MPDPTNTPASAGPILRDPLLGHEVPAYLGGDEPFVEEPTGDRGDSAPGSTLPSTEPQVTEPVVTEPTATEPVVAEPKAGEPELTDEQKAALPPRGPDGRFLKPEGQEAQSPEAKGEDDDDQPRIPKVRLDKEIEKRRALEARVKELEATKQAESQAATQTYDFDGAERQYMDLMLDGKLDEAAAKRREIRAAERAEYEALAAVKAGEVNTQDAMRKSFESISAQFEKDYAGFNPESDQYDAAALEQAKAIYQGYLASGIFESPVEAFEKALLTTVAANGWERPAPAGARKPNGAAGAPRTAQKRVEAIGAQPPLTAQAGQSGASQGAAAVPDPSQLTEEQLSKLPIATLKRLRGDEL